MQTQRTLLENERHKANKTDLHCEPKKTQKCFLYKLYKTWLIVIKFGTYCPE